MIIRARDLALGAPLLLTGRRAGAGPAAGLFGPCRAGVVPPDGFLCALPADVAVTSANAPGLTVRGGGDLVVVLCAAGAPLGLPARLAGCLGLEA